MITIHINKTQQSDYPTIQAALDALKDSSEPATIIIGPGLYEEKLYIRSNHLTLIGEDPETTILSFSHGAKSLGPDGKPMGTFNSFSVLFTGSDIEVRNLTLQNTSGPGSVNGQAVAAFITSNQTRFYNCRFIAFQDTIYCGMMSEEFMNRIHAPQAFKQGTTNVFFKQNQVYFKDCYIEGDVDYIFGPGLGFFEDCHIHTIALVSEGTHSYITAANTPNDCDYGFIFMNCTITGAEETRTYLGRPWRSYAKTIFCECTLDESIHPHGWHNWDKPEAEMTSQYIEINNVGPGADLSDRCTFSKSLTDETLKDILDSMKPCNCNPSQE